MTITYRKSATRTELPSASPFRPLISANCLIIPVFFGIWWFWFRRKATSVFQTLLIKDQQQQQEGEGEGESKSNSSAQERRSTTTRMPIPDAGSKSWDHASLWANDDDDDDHEQFSTWCVS